MLNAIFLFFLVLISFGLGQKVFRLFRINLDNPLERFVFSVGIGLGIVSYLTLLLAVLGLLYKWACLLLLAVLLVIALWGVWKNRNISLLFKKKFHNSFRLEKSYIFEYCLVIILFFYISLCLLSAIAPPVDWDSLAAHLAIPKLWIQHHEAIHIPYIWESGFHLTVETLYALGMILINDTTPCLIIWMCSLLLILSVFSFCQRYFSAKIGILAVSALYCTPLFSAISSRPMVDIPVSFYAFLGFYSFFKYLNSDDRKMLLLASVMSGFAAACKHLGIIPFLTLSVWLVIMEVKQRKSIRTSLKYIALFNIIFLLILTPWFVKNYINTGNIINTSVSGISMMLGTKELKVEIGFEKILNYTINVLRFLLIDNLFERTLSGTLWSSGVFILAFVPCLVLFKIDKGIKYLLIYSICTVIFYLPTFTRPSFLHLRYMAPILPCLFISGAYSVHRLMSDYEYLKKYIKIIIILSIIFNIIPIAKWTYKSLPVTIGIETKESYLDRRTYIYNAAQYVNNNLADTDRVLSMDLRGYYFDKPYATILTISDVAIKNPDTDEVFFELPKLIERIKSEGITHLFVNPNYANTGYKPLPDELRKFLKPIYTNNNVYLYKFDFSEKVLLNSKLKTRQHQK